MTWSDYDLCSRCFESYPCVHVGAAQEAQEAAEMAAAPLLLPPTPEPELQAPVTIDTSGATRPASLQVRRSRIVRWATEQAGLSLWPRQQEALHAVSESDARLIVALWGRQGGKTTHFASPLAVFEGVVNHAAHTAGRRGRPVILIVANSQRQAELTREAIGDILATPSLAGFVESATQEQIRLRTGLDIVVVPTNARTIRGRSVCVAILDEFALAVDADGSLLSPQAAGEILSAIRPAMVTFAHAKLIVTSTPRGRSGPFYDLFKEASGDADRGLVLHQPTWQVNPTPSVLAEVQAAYATDPVMARREYGAEWVDEIGQVLGRELIEAAVRDHGTQPPAAGNVYGVAMDPSGLTGNDSYVVAAYHVDRADVLHVDWADEWIGTRGQPPDQRPVADAIAEVVRAYRVSRVVSDQYAFGSTKLNLEDRGVKGVRLINFDQAVKVRGLSLLRQRLLAGTLSLPNTAPKFAAQLSILEVSRLPGGKERISAPKGLHDDWAMCLILACLQAEADAPQRGRVGHAPSPWA
ncbi:MAG: hypothetical protein H0U86_15070 [Chloroflexi bacterium]|nr:hypothetical protein [Chloroflexota bacterium]